MAEVEIRGRISVDAGNAVKSTQDYIDAVKQAKKAVNEAKVGSEEYRKAQEKLTSTQKEFEAASNKMGGSFGKLKDTLGQVVPGFEGASQGASGLGKQLWLLVANPIVAIVAGLVAVLTLLYKAFASTNEGADKIEQVFAGIGATVEVLRDRILGVAKAIGEFFSGDFKAALETGKAAVSGIGQEIANEFAAASQATKTLQDLEDTMRSISVNRALLNRDLAKAKETMTDADATFADRRAALEKVREAEKKQIADELAAARTKYDALKQDADLTKNVSDAKLNALAAAQAEVYNLEASSASQIRSLNKMSRTLEREENAKAEAAQKAIDDKKKADKEAKEKAEKERMTKYVAGIKAFADEENAALLAGLELQKGIDAEKDLLAQKEIDRASFQALITETNYNKQKALKEQEKADEQALVDFKMSVYAQQLSGLSILGNTIQQFAGKSKAAMATGILIEKAAAIGQILISGFQANAKSVAASPLTLGQPFVGIQNVMTGLQIAGTVKAASTALGQIGSGGGSGGAGSSLTQSPSAPLIPQAVNTRLDQQSIQGVGNAATGGVSRSFVLDADIKTNQERQARISRAARLS